MGHAFLNILNRQIFAFILAGTMAACPAGALAAGNSPPASGDASAPAYLTETISSWNGPDALAAYRKMWNPLAAGPQLIPMADTTPPGEFIVRPFFYSQFVQAQYTDSWGIHSLPSGFYQSQLLSLVQLSVGILPNLDATIFPAMITTWSEFDNVDQSSNGLSDTTMELKYRFYIQHPKSLVPSMSFALHLTLPTSSWAGTQTIKGGMPPLARIPSTHFGEPGLTPALLMRTIAKPFRIYGGLFYTFDFPSQGTLPGQTGRTTIQYGDLLQYRLGLENLVNDDDGLGYILEFVGMSGLPFSVDGLPINGEGGIPGPFNLFGFQPTLEINLTDRLIFAAGVLLPVAGTNQYQSISPNFSIYWYWGPHGGKVIPL